MRRKLRRQAIELLNPHSRSFDREVDLIALKKAEIGEKAESSRMYEVKAELNSSEVYLNDEVTKFCAVSYHSNKAESVSDKINAVKNLYVFLSQIIHCQDSDLEKLYKFLRYLSAKLSNRKSESSKHLEESSKIAVLSSAKNQPRLNKS